MDKDLRVLADFVELYCKQKHKHREKSLTDLEAIETVSLERPVRLCASCRKLLAHALVKRIHCPMHPKPSCKHCPNHCYHPAYRQSMKEVMKYSGRKLVLSGRLSYLFQFLF